MKTRERLVCMYYETYPEGMRRWFAREVQYLLWGIPIWTTWYMQEPTKESNWLGTPYVSHIYFFPMDVRGPK